MIKFVATFIMILTIIKPMYGQYTTQDIKENLESKQSIALVKTKTTENKQTNNSSHQQDNFSDKEEKEEKEERDEKKESENDSHFAYIMKHDFIIHKSNFVHNYNILNCYALEPFIAIWRPPQITSLI